MTASQYLATFLNYEKHLAKFTPQSAYLKRVAQVLSQLGSPQDGLKIIHIAGSKGKGSTAAFIANILKEAGFTVGLYTSPHLYDVHERIRVLSRSKKTAARNQVFSDCISEKSLSSLIRRIRPQLENGRKQGLTYFEVLTILTFCYFKEQRVDWVVLETGLGGRLDATNVCKSAVSVITPISLEHTAQLGNTLSEIAGEKAAIIKDPSTIAVIAPQPAAAMRVIQKRCHAVGAKKIVVGRSGNFLLPLLGRHQLVNANVAASIADTLGIPGAVIKRGLAKTFWPLRFEIIRRKPLIILDGAHNPESCGRLVETLKDKFPDKKWVLIFGCSDDKNIQGMARLLFKKCGDVILTSSRHPRAMMWDTGNTARYFPGQDLVITQTVPTACRFAKKIAGQNGVVVAGSLFTAAEARKVFQNL